MASSTLVMVSLVFVELLLVGVLAAGWWAGAALGRHFRRRKATPALATNAAEGGAAVGGRAEGGAADGGRAEGGAADGGRGDEPAAETAADDTNTDRITDSLAFVGGAYGILLGLLLVFAVGHFVDTRQAAREEAITAAALFNIVEPYPTEARDALRHDLVCLMRTSATDDWAAAKAGDFTGSENTNTYALAVQRQVEALPQDTATEASNHYFATESNLNLAKSRQLRLLYAAPEIPPAVWLVIYVSAFVFIGLMAFHLGERTRLARIALPATGLVLIAIVGSLAALDTPYSGAGVALKPLALEAALSRLQDAYPEPAALWAPCDRLAAEQQE